MSRTKTRHPKEKRPPTNLQAFACWADFPEAGKRHCYEVIDPSGEQYKITVTGKAKNRVLRGLMNGPTKCGSAVRIGMFVHLLREGTGLSIRTDEYHADNRDAGGFDWFGAYTLETNLRRLDEGRAE